MKNLIIMVFVNVLALFSIFTMHNYGGSEILFSFSSPTREDININKIVIDEDFVKHGKWMSGKHHNQTCAFIDKKKCCKKKQNLHFEFDEERLNQIDAVEELRKKLRNKKLLLIGDSLMFEFFIELAELLKANTTREMSRVFCERTCSINPSDMSTVTYLRTCMIVLEGKKPVPDDVKWRQIAEKIVRKEIANYTLYIILFNQGIHYDIRMILLDSTIHFNNVGKMLHGKTHVQTKYTIEFFLYFY